MTKHDLGDAFGPGASLQSSISAAPPIAALNRVMRQAPCGHENLDTRLGDGKTWAKCEDCGATIEQANVQRARKAAAQFEDDIALIRAALESNAVARRCAEICTQYAAKTYWGEQDGAEDCAAAIRAEFGIEGE